MGLFNRKQPAPIAQKSYTTYQLMPKVGWTPKFRLFSARQAIQEGFRRSTWVYSCVRLRAANIASVPWVVERRSPEGWEELEDHPLKRLIDRPNPMFDWSEIMRRAVYSMDLSGDGYGTIIRNGDGEPREIWPLIPDNMNIVPGLDAVVAEYEYKKGSITKRIPAEDVLHLKYVHPDDLYYGLAPLEAAARAVDIDEEAEKWQKKTLENMGVPPGVFSFENISQQEYEQAKQWVAEQSGAENARKPWVLGNGKYSQMSQNAVDMDFINGRKMSREEICAVYSVPPPLVGIYENATLANIETARQILWREGLIPALDEIEGQLNIQLVRQYGTDIRLRYDLSNVEALAENYTEKVTNARQLWGMGVPLDEINRRLEMGLNTDDIVGSDLGYLPSGLLPTDFDLGTPEPGGNAAAQAAGMAGDEGDEES
ncbi:MAG: phage portal protein [Advenella sp.]